MAAKTKFEICPDKKHSIRWLNITFNPTFLIASNSGGSIWIAKYDKNSENIISTTAPDDLFRAHDGYILQASVSSDVKTLATCSADRTVKLWKIRHDAPYLELDKILYGHTGWVWDSAFLNDNSHVLSVSTDKYLKVWRVSDGTLIKNACQHSKGVVCMVLYDWTPPDQN